MHRPRAGLPPGLLLLGALAGACGPSPLRVAAESDAWLLGVSAVPGRVLCVGGRPGRMNRTGEGVVLRVRGGATETFPSPRPGVLWWVHDVGGGVAWLAGEDGTVLRYDEARDPPELAVVPTDTSATLYGVWAFSDDEVWAVGEDLAQSRGVVLTGGRAGLHTAADVPLTRALFKVFATDREHLFVVGAGATLLRRVVEGGAPRWQRDLAPIPQSDRLLTVHGPTPDEVFAVGGAGMGRLLRWDGASWSLLDTPGFGGLNGLFATAGEVFVVGNRGLAALGPSGGAPALELEVTELDLHAAFRLGEERFAVGGNLSQPGIRPPRGVLLRSGR